jgi:NAD(P)-dependent dehydrogenase (short-subunit alcohol dehydrogenase family)
LSTFFCEETRVSRTLDLFRLDGKIALVTGGTGIYGSHITRALAEAGAVTVVASRNGSRCKSFAEALSNEGLQVEGDECDLALEEEIRALRDRILKRHGRLDVLFNNAVARSGGDLRQATGVDWDTAMRVNSTGLFLSCKIFSEPMQAQRSGSIVNIASIYGMVGPDFSIYEGTTMTNPVNYAFAKGGMINLTRYLASFLAPHNIRVNCLSPGGFETQNMPEPFLANYRRKTLLGRMAEADDIKGPAVFLASDASRYITGQNVAVDGGWTAV